MKTLIIILIFWAALLIYDQIWHRHYYPSPDKLKVENGIIHHPTYGNYPQKVQYKDGMHLYPGQEATGFIVVEVKDRE